MSGLLRVILTRVAQIVAGLLLIAFGIGCLVYAGTIIW